MECRIDAKKEAAKGGDRGRRAEEAIERGRDIL
jgi:hypothetical protein